ncbi:MAG TPA: hypothetical protein VER55_01370 [Ardenticatenaceae bacterium]|nr:hypothetical protein [Ardenticatenaceae bacterium]
MAEVQALPPADRVKLVQAVIQQLYDELEVEAVQLDALETGTARVAARLGEVQEAVATLAELLAALQVLEDEDDEATERAVARYAAWKLGRSRARSYSEIRAELVAEGLMS